MTQTSNAGSEHQLTSQRSCWMSLENKYHCSFKGSCTFFSYQVHVFPIADVRASDTAYLVAQFTICSTTTCSGPMRCSIRFDVETYAQRGQTVPERGSCLFDPGAGQVFTIPFPSKVFGPALNESRSIGDAFVTIELLQLVLPTKYSVLAAPGLATLNDPDLSDCSIAPKDSAVPIHVSRAILARASPFFVTMFKGNWAEFLKSNTPINFGWPASALLPCLIHMYSGWVIGDPLPLDHSNTSDRTESGTQDAAVTQDQKVTSSDLPLAAALCTKYAVDAQALTVHQLLELMDLARLLELTAMVVGANHEMVRVLKVELGEVSKDLTVLRKREEVDLQACIL